MTVREYIGARYVPIFMGEWVQTNTYEPLSVVTYQGASYTSRQFVPANVEITNTDYWYVSANYNAQIEAYRQEVVQVSTQIGGIEDDIADEVSAREAADTALSGRIDAEASTRLSADTTLGTRIENEETERISEDEALDGRISDLQYFVSHSFSPSQTYTGTNLVWFGDSFSAPNITNSVDAYMPKRVSAALGTTLFNYAVGGRGFGRTGNKVVDDVAIAQNSMSEDDRNSTSIVVCICGCNDLLNDVDSSTVYQGMRDFLISAHSAFPNAHIYVFPFNWGCNKLGHAVRLDMNNAMANIGFLNTPWASIIDKCWTWNLGIPSRYQNEVHPNESGYQIMSGHVIQAIAGESVSGYLAQDYDYSAASTELTNAYVWFTYADDIVHVHGYYSKNTDGAATIQCTSGLHPLLTPYSPGTMVIPSAGANTDQHGSLNFGIDRTLKLRFPSNYTSGTLLFFDHAFVPSVGAAY